MKANNKLFLPYQINSLELHERRDELNNFISQLIREDVPHIIKTILEYLVVIRPSNLTQLTSFRMLMYLYRYDGKTHEGRMREIHRAYFKEIYTIYPQTGSSNAMKIIRINKCIGILEPPSDSQKFIDYNVDSFTYCMWFPWFVESVVISCIKISILLQCLLMCFYWIFPNILYAKGMLLMTFIYFISTYYISGHLVGEVVLRKHCQSISPKKKYSAPTVERSPIVTPRREQRIININEIYYAPNKNRKRRFSYHYLRISKTSWRPRKLNFQKEPQMEFFSKMMPTITVDVSDRLEQQTKAANENFEKLHEVVENISKHGLTHNIKFPTLENIFSQLSDCWNTPKVRETLIMFATILVRIANFKLRNDALKILNEVLSLYINYNCVDSVKQTIFGGITIALQGIEFYISSNEAHDSAQETEQVLALLKKPQMDADLLAPLITAIYAWMYYSAFDKEYKGDSLSGFLKECHSIKKAKEGCMDLVEFVCECFERLVKLLSGESFSNVFSNNMFPELDVIAKETQEYLEQFNKGIPFSKEEAVKIIDLVNQLEKLVVKIPKSAAYTEYYKKAVLLQNRVNSFVKEIKKMGMFDDGVRITPMAILIVGPSGVGKSTCLTQLMYELAALTMEDEMFKRYEVAKDDFQYTYCPENVYFDRYRKQYFCVVDEFGAIRYSIQKPNDGYLFIMRAINCWPYPVHMADLADKGMMFDSQFIIAIGNIKSLLIHSLIDPEPVCRRITFPLIMVPKKPFCLHGTADSDNLWDRRLNVDALYGRKKTDFSHMEFYTFDPVTGNVTSSATEWRAMVDKMAATYRNRRSESKDRLAALPEIQEHCRTLRQQFFPQMDLPYHCLKSPDVDITELQTRVNKIWYDFVDKCEDIYYDVTDAMVLAKELVVEVTGNILNIIKNNVVVSSLIISVPVALMAWKYFTQNFLKIEQSAFPKLKLPVKAQVKTNARIVSKQKEQMCSANTNFDNVVSAVLKNNHYLIKTNKGQRASFTFIKGRIGIFPHHFWCHWKELEEEGDEVILTFSKCLNPGSSFEIKFKDIKFLQLEGDIDLIFALIPKTYMHRDISKFLVDREEKIFLGNFHGALARFNNDLLKIHTTEIRTIGALRYSYYANERSYEYNIATTIGECGEILFSSDSRITTKLLGIHVCGDVVRSGDSVAVFKEDFDMVFDTFEKEGYQHVQVEVEDDMIPIKGPQMDLDPRFVLIKKIPKMFSSTKNNIIRSPLYEAWGPAEYAPTVLRTVDGVNPWVKARQNYNPPYKCMDLRLLDIVTQSYANLCRQTSRKSFVEPYILSYKQAVEGIPGEYKGIPRDTSAGYPYAQQWKGKGKTPAFGEDGPYTFDSPLAKELEKDVETALEAMKKGKRVEFFFMDHLKAERRKTQKVKDMKVRMFSASPLVYAILCRRYFGSFTQWMIDNRIFNGVAVGINPFSDDWATVVKHLRSVGDLNIFGDYAKYDGSQSPMMLYAALQFIEAYYYNATPEERLIRAVLYEDLVNSKHIYNFDDEVKIAYESCKFLGVDIKISYVYEWMGALPSGHVLTVFINSIVNNILIRYCSVMIMKDAMPEKFDRSVPDTEFLEANLRIITYGDDNGISVSEALEAITQSAMTFHMSLIGMTYTAEDKESIHETHRTLTDCSFLKCAFRLDKDTGKWVAAQALDSILDMPYWTKSNGKDPESVNKTVDTLLHKLALHGKETYNEWAPKIIEASCSKLNYRPIYTTYSLNRDAILDMEFEF